MSTTFEISIPKWYQDYINEIGERDYMDLMKENYEKSIELFLSIPEEKWNFAYAPGKWTIKELVIHMMDAERVFAYRALRFSRNDKTELPGFEENEYVPFYNAKHKSEVAIIEEYKAVRNATIAMFSNFDNDMLKRTGTANKNEFSVEMIGAIIVGHELHHLDVLKDRYLFSS